MKRLPISARTAAVVLSLYFAVSPGQATGQNGVDWGRRWDNLDNGQKAAFCIGFQKGVFHLSFAGLLLSGGVPATDHDPEVLESLQLSADQRRIIGGYVRALYDQLDSDPFEITTVVRVMDQLYEDRANSAISWSLVLEVALMRLYGTPAAIVNRRLEDLRFFASRG